MPANDPLSDKFEIKVNFTNFEKTILDKFAKEIKDASLAITAIAGKMDQQIAALKAIQIDIKKYSRVAGATTTGTGDTGPAPGGRGPGVGGGGYDVGGGGGGAFTGGGVGGGDASGPGYNMLLLQAIKDLGEKIEIVGTGGGGGGAGDGYLGGGNWRTMRGHRIGNFPWEDPHRRRTEAPQYLGGQFSLQTGLTAWARNLRRASPDGTPGTGYNLEGTEVGITAEELKRRHQIREDGEWELNRGPGGRLTGGRTKKKTYQEIWEDESGKASFFRGGQAGAALRARNRYVESLGTDSTFKGKLANFYDETNAALMPYRPGGLYHPATYMPAVRRAQGKIQAASTFGRYGKDLGYDPGGVTGAIDVFGKAGGAFFGAKKDEFLNSWGGFNPFLSGKEAGEITAAVKGLGYGGDIDSGIRNVMSGVTQHTGIGITDQAEIIDKSIRWGFQSLKEVAFFMENDMPKAAQAARMTVDSFTKQMVAGATQLSATTGTSFPMAAQALSNLSLGTGMNPGQGLALMSSKPIEYWAASDASRQAGGGFNLSNLLDNSNQSTMYLQTASKWVKAVTGSSVQQSIELQKRAEAGDESAKRQLKLVFGRYEQAASEGHGIPGMDRMEQVMQLLSPAAIKRTHIISEANQMEKKAATLREDARGPAQKAYDLHANYSHNTAADKKWRAEHHGMTENEAIRHDQDVAENKFSSSMSRKELVKRITSLAQNQNWGFHHDRGTLGFGGDKHDGQNYLQDVLGGKDSTNLEILHRLNKQEQNLTKQRNADNSDNKGGKVKITLEAGPTLRGIFQQVGYNQNGNSPNAPSVTSNFGP